MATNATSPGADVDKAMEGLQKLLDSLEEQQNSSDSSLAPLSKENDASGSVSKTSPGLDVPPDTPVSSNDFTPDHDDRPMDHFDTGLPRPEPEGISHPDAGQPANGILSNSGDTDRSPKPETPKTGNSVTFSLPDEAKPDDRPIGSLSLRRNAPSPLTKPSPMENNWRDSINEPRPSPCHTPNEKESTSFPYNKDQVFAGRSPPKSPVGTDPTTGVEIAVPAVSCPHPSTLDRTDGSRATLNSDTGSDVDDLSHDDVIQALKDSEDRKHLIEKLFPAYLESTPNFSAPDGGYAWVILVASFLVQALSVALPLSFGVFYLELMSYFGDTGTNTAWIGAIAAGFGLGAGPISSLLCNYVGFRITCFIGGIVASVGLFVSSFAPNIFMLYGTFGLLTGLGVSISYIPSVVIIGYYFDKKRSLANGIACSGVAVGTLVYPVAIEALVVAYTWRGAMIVLSGVILNCCVLGLLLRPTKYCRIMRRRVQDQKSSLNVELFSDWRFCLFCLSEILWNIGSLVILTAAPDHALLKGTSEDKAALLLSISGIGGFVGRILMAVLTNFKACNRLLCLAVATLVTVFPLALFTVSDLYPVLVTHCLVYGLGFGFQLGLLALVTLDLFSLEKLTSAYGWVMLSDGIGAFLGPIITGVLYDRSKDYFPSFMFGAMVSLLAAVIFFILVIHQCNICKARDKKRKRQDIEEHYHTDGFL